MYNKLPKLLWLNLNHLKQAPSQQFYTANSMNDPFIKQKEKTSQVFFRTAGLYTSCSLLNPFYQLIIIILFPLATNYDCELFKFMSVY